MKNQNIKKKSKKVEKSKNLKKCQQITFFKSDNLNKYIYIFFFPQRKNAIILVLPFKEISIWLELSSPPCFII